VTSDPAFAAAPFSLTGVASMDEAQFREQFRESPVSRAKYSGLLRNAALAMGNLDPEEYREPLTQLARHEHPQVREHAAWALRSR
jgi:epoxyqueuosine reductase QueG